MIVSFARPPERRSLKLEHIIYAVLAQQGNLLRVRVVAIEARLTGIYICVEVFAGDAVRGQGAVHRNELRGRIAVRVLKESNDRELGVRGRQPAERRHQDRRRFIDLVNLRSRVPVEGDHPIEQFSIGPRNRSGHIARNLVMIIIADLRRNLPAKVLKRRLGHIVDDAARRALTVEHRSRPLEHFDLLDRVHIGAGGIVAAEEFLNRVAIARDAQSPGEREVAARGEPIGFGGHARHIGQRFGQSQRALVDEHVGGFNRQRPRRLDNRGFRLGRAERARCARDNNGFLTALFGVAFTGRLRPSWSGACQTHNKRNRTNSADPRYVHFYNP